MQVIESDGDVKPRFKVEYAADVDNKSKIEHVSKELLEKMKAEPGDCCGETKVRFKIEVKKMNLKNSVSFKLKGADELKREFKVEGANGGSTSKPRKERVVKKEEKREDDVALSGEEEEQTSENLDSTNKQNDPRSTRGTTIIGLLGSEGMPDIDSGSSLDLDESENLNMLQAPVDMVQPSTSSINTEKKVNFGHECAAQ